MTLEDFSSFPDVLTIYDLQNLLHVSRTTAYRLVGEGQIKCVRIGRAIRIPRKYLIDFLKENVMAVEDGGDVCYNQKVTVDKSCLSQSGGKSNDRLSAN